MILSETKNDTDKNTWLERQRQYLLKKEIQLMHCHSKRRLILSKNDVVNGLCYNPKRCEFEATVKYLDENKVQKEAEIMVFYAWVVKEYGALLANKLMDIAENEYFLKTPLDGKGHATYFQHEGKDVRDGVAGQ